MFKYLILSFYFFILGIIGLTFIRRHMMIILIYNELIFLAANLNFLAFSIFLDDFSGQIFCLFLLAVAAAETAVGLSIIILYFRFAGSISVDMLSLLKF